MLDLGVPVRLVVGVTFLIPLARCGKRHLDRLSFLCFFDSSPRGVSVGQACTQLTRFPYLVCCFCCLHFLCVLVVSFLQLYPIFLAPS
ncbi:hypothetical protein BDV25DRAFT_53530 [Aspergillus avenaceus]|uniref:Uncharacterized protein n=1 Tax=Aspergillus avenaceus TaxID=36643 RepID=A0A5N6TJ45_ASPAV|nr:hypothetical protein BDV25DRAFT_53530 [Aspergillus avenaceus]